MKINKNKWFIFCKERFNPLAYLLMIIGFLWAHQALFDLQLSVIKWLLVFAVSIFFFFKLRLYDELKDYQLDCQINPTRPLARGLLSCDEVKQTILYLIIMELFFGFLIGEYFFIGLIIAIGYSLLMYNEFFIPHLIRPHLTTYAVTHTVVCGLFSLALSSGLQQTLPTQADDKNLAFAVLNWCLFNVFEFGRKTFASSEEKQNIDSYSQLFGRIGAVFLTGSMIILSYLLFFYFNYKKIVVLQLIYFSLVLLAFFIVAGFYFIKDSLSTAKIYRTYSSLLVILFYLGVIIF